MESVRCSNLTYLAQCPGHYVLRLAEALMGRDDGGAAAQTGSAVGKVIELWHRGGEDPLAFDGAMASAQQSGEYPEARWDEVLEWGLHYATDPRNQGVVLASRCEAEVTVELPPAPEDPTGEPVVLKGHIDQARSGDTLTVWDLKSGQPTGQEMLWTFAWQVAAYALACTATWGVTVLPGGIIRLRGYGSTGRNEHDPSQAATHYPMPWTLDTCREMMSVVAYRVAELRRGVVAMTPGPHCRWCPGVGPAECGPRIDVAQSALDASTIATEADPALISELATLGECPGGAFLGSPPIAAAKPNLALAAHVRALGRTGL